MGVATGLVNFTRHLGGVFGVAIGAALMLTALTDRLAALFPHTHVKASALLSPQAAAAFPAETQHLVRGAFSDALHVVFMAALVIVLIGIVSVALMPGGKPADIRDAARATVPEPVLPDGEMILVETTLSVPVREPVPQPSPPAG
jgi:hypothetical protein